MKPPIDHIVWDWNGTILGDSRALIDATIDAFAACAMPPVTVADYQRHHVQPIPVFYNRLAGRILSDDEQRRLDEAFQAAYQVRRDHLRLTADSIEALTRWRDAGRSQSLLSMHPHDRLTTLVSRMGIERFFTRVDGSVGHLPRKAPHLRRHLQVQGIPADRVLVVGDSRDDALAARECGAHCLLYHPGDDALHDRAHFDDLEFGIVGTLLDAIGQVTALSAPDGPLGELLSRSDEPVIVGVAGSVNRAGDSAGIGAGDGDREVCA